MSDNKPMTIGEFREYTKNLAEDTPIHLHDSNLIAPVAIIGIHQKILFKDMDSNDEILSIILEVLEIEIEE